MGLAGAISVPVLVALLATGLLLFYLWQGTTIRDLHAQRAAAREALTMTQEVNRTLEFEIGQAFSLDRISALAKSMGMVPPSQIRYVPLPPAPKDR